VKEEAAVWRWNAFRPPVCICFHPQGNAAAGTTTIAGAATPRGSWWLLGP